MNYIQRHSILILCLSLVLHLSGCANHRCFMRQNTQVCYSHHHGHSFNWTEAERYCNQLKFSGHLASIHTENETEIISSLRIGARRTPESYWSDCWIGLFDPKLESMSMSQYAAMRRNQFHWEWSDGSVVDYTHWSMPRNKASPDEPSWHSNLKESCVEVHNIGGGDINHQADWNNDGCTKPQTCFICQYYTKQQMTSMANIERSGSNGTSTIVALLLAMILLIIVINYLIGDIIRSRFIMLWNIVRAWSTNDVGKIKLVDDGECEVNMEGEQHDDKIFSPN